MLERVCVLNDLEVKRESSYVVYWMYCNQRVEENTALQRAIYFGNRLNKHIKVILIWDDCIYNNKRHMTFALQGVAEIAENLKRLGVGFEWVLGSAIDLMESVFVEAALSIVDYGHLKQHREWMHTIVSRSKCRCEAVEINVIVPVEQASSKLEYNAYNLRRKIICKVDGNIENMELEEVAVKIGLSDFKERFKKEYERVQRLSGPQSVASMIGGSCEGYNKLGKFLEKIKRGCGNRMDPSENCTSELSPYLHYGHIEPRHFYRKIKALEGSLTSEILDQLLVRRELAFNFVMYCADYDIYEAAVPEWAKKTLEKHKADVRDVIYSLEQLEQAKTHDPYWNAAQNQLIQRGIMHNTMRMYWCKKIIEWTEGPERAWEYSLYLNNHYGLDGYGPNSYAGIAWCFGRHDRPWTERAVFGTVRYMNDKGLKRKYQMTKYLKEFGME